MPEAEALARRAFDLAGAPLLRVCLLRVESEFYLKVVSLNYPACNGWSMEVFIADLLSLYEAYCAGVAPAKT